MCGAVREELTSVLKLQMNMEASIVTRNFELDIIYDIN